MHNIYKKKLTNQKKNQKPCSNLWTNQNNYVPSPKKVVQLTEFNLTIHKSPIKHHHAVRTGAFGDCETMIRAMHNIAGTAAQHIPHRNCPAVYRAMQIREGRFAPECLPLSLPFIGIRKSVSLLRELARKDSDEDTFSSTLVEQICMVESAFTTPSSLRKKGRKELAHFAISLLVHSDKLG